MQPKRGNVLQRRREAQLDFRATVTAALIEARDEAFSPDESSRKKRERLERSSRAAARPDQPMPIVTPFYAAREWQRGDGEDKKADFQHKRTSHDAIDRSSESEVPHHREVWIV
jgi:hypothetical protein